MYFKIDMYKGAAFVSVSLKILIIVIFWHAFERDFQVGLYLVSKMVLILIFKCNLAKILKNTLCYHISTI